MKLFSNSLKATEILIYIYENNNPIGNRISRDLCITYSHVFNVLNELEKIKLITSEKSGRSRYFKITSRGAAIAVSLIEIERLLK